MTLILMDFFIFIFTGIREVPPKWITGDVPEHER